MNKKSNYTITVLDAQGMNPGDISWNNIKNLGEIRFFDNTSYDMIIERAKDGENRACTMMYIF